MAVRGMGIVVAMVTLSTLWAGASAQSSCTTALVSLSPCLSYIMGNSSTPTATCCSQLANVVASQPRCLCMVLDGEAAASLGITINQTLALGLPSACNVQTPPVSACKAAGAPAGLPADSPTGSPAPIPSQGKESSDANLTTLSSSSILFLFIFIASYAASLTSF
ncbi:non-specific lipid transfer protein GPI-anchored 5-like [Aristolochia californica]|uniref:non-specific lipid transfer protein GPI-anchored 5-like n=1 Tax=Aristolochia californica TaxID=171875 RepID=UPI0035D6F247